MVLQSTLVLKATNCLDITKLVVYKAMTLLKLCSLLGFLVTLTHLFCISSLAYNTTNFERCIQTRPYLGVEVLRNCSINYQHTLILEHDVRQTFGLERCGISKVLAVSWFSELQR